MEIKEIQKEVDKLIQKYGGYWKPLSMMARITEEVGELARAMNIKHGDKRSKGESDGRDIEKELADVVFTTFAIANAEGVDLEKVFMEKLGLDYKKMEETYSK
ncbi:MAG: MazG nucleotide pyrophosphohydrolase domain-containing protein [archaeon]